MSERALITGGSGYLGFKLHRSLLSSGWTVGLLLREGSSLEKFGQYQTESVYICDGSYESVDRAVGDFRPTVVFHLASLFLASHKSSDISNLVESNVTLGTHLVQACANNDVRRFINAGSSWQHYEGKTYDPVCLYAATKEAFQNILEFYVRAYPLAAISLQLPDTYGPGDWRTKIINLLINSLASGEHLSLSPGYQKLDFVYIDDIVSAFTRAAELSKLTDFEGRHCKYSLSSNQFVSLRDLVAMIEQYCGRQLSVKFGAKEYRSREVMVPGVSEPPLPDWHPQVSLANGLQEVIKEKVV